MSIQYKGDMMIKKGNEIIVLMLSVCAVAFIYFKFAVKDIAQTSILEKNKLSKNGSDVLNQIPNDTDQEDIKISDIQDSEPNSNKLVLDVENENNNIASNAETPSKRMLKKAKYYLDRNWAGDDNCPQSVINYLILNPNALNDVLNSNIKVVDNSILKSDITSETKISSLK